MSSADRLDLEVLQTHEYDAQFFGFTIEDFMRAMKTLFKDEVTRHVQSLNTSLRKADRQPENCSDEVTKATDKLTELYLFNAQAPFKELEERLKDIFHIPEHVLLPGDEAQKTQYSAQDEQEVNHKWSDLMSRMKRKKKFSIELRQELKMLRQIIPVLTQRRREFEQVQNGLKREDAIVPQLESAIDEEVNRSLELINIKKKYVKNSRPCN